MSRLSNLSSVSISTLLVLIVSSTSIAKTEKSHGAKSNSADLPASESSSPDANAVLDQLLKIGLENSLDRKSQNLDVQSKLKSVDIAKQGKLLPQVSATGVYQDILHDNQATNSNGNLVNNNGYDATFAFTVTYDLQKLFGPELALAKRTADVSKIQNEIARRDLIRTIKKSYFQIREIQQELAESAKMIALFDRVQGILKRQNKMGVFNDIEIQQFQVQQSMLKTDVESRTTDLEVLISQLAANLNIDRAQTKTRIGDLGGFTYPLAPINTSADLSVKSDSEILQSFQQSSALAKFEADSFQDYALPSVYARVTRDNAHFVSSDGPQTIGEVGISLPIDSFFTRPTQKSLLNVTAERTDIIAKKAIVDYRTQVETTENTLKRLKNQSTLIEQTYAASDKLLDKSFLYFSQKRLDAVGTLDIFSKFLQAAKNRANNQMQIASLDAELEYLLGGVAQ